MGDYLTTTALLSFVTLALMEIVLGIDNIIFISILTSKLPKGQEGKARNLGISLALLIRLALLFGIKWIMGLTKPLFMLPIVDKTISGKELILLGGGLFLIAKSTHEIYDKLEGGHGEKGGGGAAASFGATLAQILALDVVFSLDSVITAVGMANQVGIMAAAMIVAVIVMLVSARSVGDFVNRHPSMKILALSFLLLIGVMLVAEGFGQHINKGYIYFAMAFSLLVELMNMRLRRKTAAPVRLYSDSGAANPR